MALILCIDTAQEFASVCLADDEKVLQLLINNEQKEHAAWLHQAINKILQTQYISLKECSAISVSNGPGSYTGLRIGLSTAKGLCYAMNIPLITLSTLKIMASAMKDTDDELICPLVDARRMEVYTAVYDKDLNEKISPAAMVIEENSFSEILSNNILMFGGSGSEKLKKIITHANTRFINREFSAADQPFIALNHFHNREFADLAYAEPFYIKEFFSSSRKP